MGLFSKLAKTAIRTVTTPVAVVKDAATLGGLCTGKNETYTAEHLKKLARAAKEVERAAD